MEEKGQIGEVEKITCREVLRLVLFFCFIVAFFPPLFFVSLTFFFFKPSDTLWSFSDVLILLFYNLNAHLEHFIEFGVVWGCFQTRLK